MIAGCVSQGWVWLKGVKFQDSKTDTIDKHLKHLVDTKARPSRPRGNDDDEVIVVDTITEPADDADAAWPESPGLDVEEEPREYNFEVAVEGEEAEEDHAEKEKKDDGENADNKEEDQVQEAVEQQVEDTEEGGDVGEDEKKEADHMMEMEADSDDERGAIRSMRQEQAKAQKRDPVMHLDSQGVFQVCKLGLKNKVNYD